MSVYLGNEVLGKAPLVSIISQGLDPALKAAVY